VQQDIRGRFKSEGTFVMLRAARPHRREGVQGQGPLEKAIDESTDTCDTIDWLLASEPGNNGRVGIAGTSYGAWLAVMRDDCRHVSRASDSNGDTPCRERTDRLRVPHRLHPRRIVTF
jgi:hypothetical protein